jgi:hypothetical protein
MILLPSPLSHCRGITTVYHNGTRWILCRMDCWYGKLGNHTYDNDEHHYSECDFETHDWNAFRTLVDMNLSVHISRRGGRPSCGQSP